MKKCTKIIRVITVAPVMALVMLLTLFVRDPALYGGPENFALSIVFLVALPISAYPLQPLFKRYRDKGRDGQRTLAIYFAVAGYIGGCLSALLLGAPKSVWIIYLAYLLSGVLVMLVNKVLRIRASGHSCGVVGPYAILIFLGQPLGYAGIPILALAWLSSLYMKRHTNLQLLGGAIIPFIALGIIYPASLMI